jgi:hypothetical protein
MSSELQKMAQERDVAIELRSVFVPEAMQDLAEGRAGEHHRKVAEASQQLTDCDVVMLAQFSMADALPAVQQTLACTVLSSPVCAVLALKKRVLDAL